MIASFHTINAHSRCEIMKILLLQPNNLASIGLDSYLRLWDLSNLDLLQQKRLKYSYLTSMANTAQEFIIGNQNGQLIFIDRATLNVNNIVKVQGDCITDILLEDQTTIMTCGNDGILARSDRRKPEEIERLDLAVPLKQMVKYKGKYYVAGMKSFEVSPQFQAKEINQSERFIQVGEKIYGTNDEMGLYCASKYYVSHFPCENMIPFSSGILGSSQSTLSYFSTHPSSSRISFKSQRMSQLRNGQSFLSFATNNTHIFAGSDCGSLHTFTLTL